MATPKSDDKTLPPLPSDETKTTNTDTTQSTANATAQINTEDIDDDDIEEEPVERVKVIYKEKKVKDDGGGLPLPRLGCRSCSCFGCLGIILVIVALISIIYFKPSIFWNPIKSFLNDGEAPPQVDTVSPIGISEQIDNKLDGGKDVEITEAQMQALLRDEIGSNDIYIDIEPNHMKIYTNIDDVNKPLWGIVEIGQDSSNDLKVTRAGFGRFGVPSSVRDFISDRAFDVLNLSDAAKGDDDAEKLINGVASEDNEGLSIDKVRFDKDKITVSAK